MASAVKKRVVNRGGKVSAVAIRRMRGKYKHFPLMDTLAEMKREEKRY